MKRITILLCLTILLAAASLAYAAGEHSVYMPNMGGRAYPTPAPTLDLGTPITTLEIILGPTWTPTPGEGVGP